MDGPTPRAARRLRSLLFVPGHKLDWMLKAPSYGPDGLILDLEDAVPLDRKDAARKAVREAITQLADTRIALFVRLNAWGTGQVVADVEAVGVPGLSGVILPKPESAEQVVALDFVLTELELADAITPGEFEIFPTPESAAGFQHAAAIAAASPRVRRFTGGGGGFTAGDATRSLNLRGRADHQQSLYTAARLNVAARAAGITQVYGGMTTNVADLDLLRASCERARDFGATGTFVIHPSHVPVAHEVFSPSAAEIAAARDVVVLMAEAIARGDAAVRHHGEMVDYAHARTSLDLLHEAESLGLDVGEYPQIDILSY